MSNLVGRKFTSLPKVTMPALFSGRGLETLARRAAHWLSRPTVRRGLHNQDALFENQALISRHGALALKSAALRAAYGELEPHESRQFELIYLVEGADLYTEGRPWAIHYPAHTLVRVSRRTRVAAGRVSPKLAARLARGLEPL